MNPNVHIVKTTSIAAATACVLVAAAALSLQPALATNIVVQPGTTAGYLYFPSTEDEIHRRLESIETKLRKVCTTPCPERCKVD